MECENCSLMFSIKLSNAAYKFDKIISLQKNTLNIANIVLHPFGSLSLPGRTNTELLRTWTCCLARWYCISFWHTLFGTLTGNWRSWSPCLGHVLLSLSFHKLPHVTNIPHFALASCIIDDHFTTILLKPLGMVLAQTSVTACNRTTFPSPMSLVDACLFESAYSFSLSFLCASCVSSTCHSASHAWSVGGRARGSLSLSFLPISNSAGKSEVTVWGVLRYWKRKSCNSLFQSFPSNFAILLAFKSVLFSISTSPSLWGQ